MKTYKKDDQIIILRAAKVRKTVIMDKLEYINEARTLLQDTTTYEPLHADPNKTTANCNNQKLKKLKDKKKLTKDK